MASIPTVREVEIPAVYKTKTVIDREARQEKVTVEAKYKSITKEVLVSKGGLTSRKEVECKLVVNTPLPIN